MKVGIISILTALLLALPAFAGTVDPCDGGGVGTDADGDGWADATRDNCSDRANPSQVDVDSDGCGNMCDPDYNQDGTVQIGDFSSLATVFPGPIGAGDPRDMTPDVPDGTIQIGDFSLLATMFLGPPGPSGTVSGTTACP